MALARLVTAKKRNGVDSRTARQSRHCWCVDGSGLADTDRLQNDPPVLVDLLLLQTRISVPAVAVVRRSSRGADSSGAKNAQANGRSPAWPPTIPTIGVAWANYRRAEAAKSIAYFILISPSSSVSGCPRPKLLYPDRISGSEFG